MGRKQRISMGRRWRVLALGMVLASVAAACGGETAPTAAPGECRSLEIVTTTSILGDVVGRVVAESGRVKVLIPVGADPHSFQASAAQAVTLQQADLIVVSGLNLEEGLHDVIEAAEAEGVTVVEAASFVATLPFGEGTHEHEEGTHEHEEGTLDPHIWTDPARMADVVAGLGEALAGADPVCADRWRAAAEVYRQELLALDVEIEAILAAIPTGQRKLVTNHRAFGYFADRYGFEVVGAIIPGGATLAAPSPADLAELVETLRREGVRAIFSETTQPEDLAAAVAAELGGRVEVVRLYTGSLGQPGSGADTYVGMQRINAQRIAAALSS